MSIKLIYWHLIKIHLIKVFIMWSANLRFFSILAVIILHVSSKFVAGYSIGSNFYGTFPWWVGNVFDSLTRWCVPIFIMISGYYLLNKTESNRIFLKKRVTKIGFPIIFWSVFFSLWLLFKNHFDHKNIEILPLL